MTIRDPLRDDSEYAARRRSAVRTAGVIALVAVAIYVGFILLGVLNA